MRRLRKTGVIVYLHVGRVVVVVVGSDRSNHPTDPG